MKKLFISILFVLLCSFCFTASYSHSGFSVKCAKCKELKDKGVSLEQQIAWRTIEYKTENGKTYAKYKCAGGHQYWAELK